MHPQGLKRIVCTFFSVLMLLSSVALSVRGATVDVIPLTLPASIDDIAYDALTRQLFVALSPSNGVSKIALLDHDSITMGPALVQGSGKAVLETDGMGGLYVAFQGSRTIVRRDIVAGTNANPFVFGPAGVSAENIRVISATNRLIAVTRNYGGVTDSILYRNGVGQGGALLYNAVRGVGPTGEYVYSSFAGVNKLKVTPTGLEVATAIGSGINGFNPDLVVANNQILLGTGQILDLDLRPVGGVPGSTLNPYANGARIFADPRTNVYAFAWGGRFILYASEKQGVIADLNLPAEWGAPAEIFPWGTSSFGLRWTDGTVGKLGVVDLDSAARSDFGMSVTRSVETAIYHQPVTYTITVTNSGPVGVDNIIVTNEFTFGMTLTAGSAIPSVGQVDLYANTTIWTVGTLGPNSSATLTVDAIATGPAQGYNETTATFSGFDSNPGNNSATNIIPIIAPLNSSGVMFQLSGAGMVADATKGDIYLSRPTPKGPFPNSVLLWKPASNTIAPIAFYPVAPGPLALSTDNRFLFVVLADSGEIEQINVSGEGIPAVRFASGFGAYVGDIVPIPGNPTSIVVASGFGSTVFDNGVARSQGGPRGAVAVTSDSQALQYDSASNPPKLNRLSLSASGIAASELPNPTVRGVTKLYSAAGEVFTDNGFVLDRDTGAVLSAIDAGIAPSWAFNDEAGEFFILSNDNVTWTLKHYDEQSLIKRAEAGVPKPLETATGLVRFGPGLFAYKTANLITAFLEPQLPNADVAISSEIIPGASGTSAEPLVWSITVTNRGPDAVPNVTITATITGPYFSFRPEEQMAGNYANPFTRIVPSLAAGESSTLKLIITPQNGGRFYLTARFDRLGADNNYGNNNLVTVYSLTPSAGIVRPYTIAVSDIDFDRASGRLVMTPMDFMKGLEGSVVSLDPVTFELKRASTLSSAGGIIAMAPAGNAGIVTTNGRAASFNLGAQTVGTSFPINGLDYDLIVRPGTSNVLVETAVAGTFIYTNGAPLVLAPPSSIAFDDANPNLLFAYDNQGYMNRFDLSTPGNDKTTDRISAGEAMWIGAANGRIIFGDGRLLDQTTLQVVGRLPGMETNKNNGQVAVDAASNRIYIFLDGTANDRVEIYDAATFTHIGGMTLNNIAKPGRFRAYNNHLALIDLVPNGWESYRVVLFDVPGTNEVDLSVIAANAGALVDVPITLNLTATNNSPWLASDVTVEFLLPNDFTVDSVPGTNVYELENNVIRFSLPQVTYGSGIGLQVTGRFASEGQKPIAGSISSAASELNPSDNQFQFNVSVSPKPTLNILNPSFIEGSDLALQLMLSQPVPVPVTFTLLFTNGTALRDDVLFLSPYLTQKVTFKANTQFASIQSISGIANAMVDGPRTITALVLSEPSLNPPAPTFAINVLDDEGLPILSTGLLPSITEDAASRTVSLGLRLNKTATNDIHFHYRFTPITATPNIDYVDASGDATIPAGFRTVSIPFTVIPDSVSEGSELVFLQLSSPENVQLLSESILLTIKDRVFPADQIVSSRITNGRFSVRFTTSPLSLYRLFRASDAGAKDWLPVGDTALHTVGGAELADPEAATATKMFYRLEKR